MFKLLYSIGLKKQEIILLLSLIVILIGGFTINAIYKTSIPHFDYKDEPDEIRDMGISNAFERFKETEAQADKMKNISDSLENVYDAARTVKTLYNSENKLNINKAFAADLMELPGIGRVTAERIIAYRDKVISFKNINELMNVKGIGAKKFDKLKDIITIN